MRMKIRLNYLEIQPKYPLNKVWYTWIKPTVIVNNVVYACPIEIQSNQNQ